MFDRLRISMKITRGYEIWSREAGLDIQNFLDHLPFSRAASYRESVRDFGESFDLNQEEVCVSMILPIVCILDANDRQLVGVCVENWKKQGKIQQGVYDAYRRAC